MKKYSDKLQDPRWQKKRLEILNRDGWSCQKCYATESTLHVHHRFYIKAEPWDHPDECLVTLCADCHQFETEERSGAESDLLKILKRHFLVDDIYALASGFHGMEMIHTSYIMANALEWLLRDHKNMHSLIEMYFEAMPHRKPKSSH